MDYYVISTSKKGEYWNGKYYEHQGEVFPHITSSKWKAKSYQSKKRAETGIKKLNEKVAYDYGFRIEKSTVTVS